jgi:arginyl-tRNA synthetase
MYLQFRDDVAAALTAALDALDLPTDDLGIEDPPEGVDAVLASSAAFRLAGEVGAPPPKVANDIADEISAGEYDLIGAALAQGPYVNFLPSDAYYEGTVEAAQRTDFGHLEPTGEEVVVEHTSANPTGPVHVGRARNPIVGDAVARILAFAGNSVDRHYYVNDAGRQMAVFTWAYETFDEDDLPKPEREKADYDLVRYYRKGNEFLEAGDPDEVEDAEAEIRAIMQGLEDGDEETYERVQEVVDTVLGGMRESLDRLPAEFDEFVKETRFLRDGSADEVVSRLKELDEAVYEEEAWQLELDEFDIDSNFVFLRSDGTTLYTTRDIAHHEWKFENYDRAITVIGEDHQLTFEQLRHALELLGHDTQPLEQVFYSWVNLPGGEGMSTRAGTGIDLDDLLDEAIDRAREEVQRRMDDRIRDDDLTDEDVERIAEQVGIGAVRYDVVSKQPSKAITFEWSRALDFEAQSAPYVQYVHARCCGILEGAGVDPDATGAVVADGFDASLLDTEAERDLVEVIGRFPAVIEEAAADLEPHVVATYTREIAETFNAFYRECPVLADDVDDDLRDARLALVAASKHAVGNALQVLGVAAPRSM